MGLPEFFNLHYELAENGLERWGFLQTCWRLYKHERHWAAPYYPALKEVLNSESNPHLKRMEPRLILKLLRHQPICSEQVIFGGVVPNYRRQGNARQLWEQAVQFARSQGWESLSISPLPEQSPAARFCTNMGGQPEQEYLLFAADL